MKHTRKYLIPFMLAILVTLPGIYLRLSGCANSILSLPVPQHALVTLLTISSGIAVLGASFLLLWACDAAQEDISQTLALAIVALIAVMPEYAVDMYITWQAGRHPAYAPLAIANMTGANRLIIGAAWAVVVGIFWLKTRRAVRIERERRTELLFLGLATLYAIVVVLKNSLVWYDGVVFFAIYLGYIRLAGRRPVAESEAEGPAELLLGLPVLARRLATAGLFVFAALVILLNARPFAEGLITTGTLYHVNKFLLVQWLAPIASEAPEFTVAIMFALRKRAGMALGSLLSSNLNQWTLLVGMIPWIYALSHHSLHTSIPMDSSQMHEILLTAAQSLLGIVMLCTLRLSIGQVLLLFLLFLGQLIVPELGRLYPQMLPFGLRAEMVHPLFSYTYFIAAIAFFLARPGHLLALRQGARVTAPMTLPAFPEEVEEERLITMVH